MKTTEELLKENGMVYYGEDKEKMDLEALPPMLAWDFKESIYTRLSETEKRALHEKAIQTILYSNGEIEVENSELFAQSIGLDKVDWEKDKEKLSLTAFEKKPYRNEFTFFMNYRKIEELEKNGQEERIKALKEEIVPGFFIRSIFESEKTESEYEYALNFGTESFFEMLDEKSEDLMDAIKQNLIENLLLQRENYTFRQEKKQLR